MSSPRPAIPTTLDGDTVSDTESWLRAAFHAYYADPSTEIRAPTHVLDREFAVIPFDADRMLRHYAARSLRDAADRVADPPRPADDTAADTAAQGASADAAAAATPSAGAGDGDLSGALAAITPEHAYYSAARWRIPSADSMPEKHWRGCDLVFDIDADPSHMPRLSDDATHRDALREAKAETQRLLRILADDYGYDRDDVQVVFSGGRGYHVHVQSADAAQLPDAARNAIADHVAAEPITSSDVFTSETVRATGAGRDTDAEMTVLDTETAWQRRIADRVTEYLRDVQRAAQRGDDDDERAAQHRLETLDGVGEERAAAALDALRSADADRIADGRVDVHQSVVRVARAVAKQSITALGVDIDREVTTDTHRLMRLPGSLHGGTALRVTRIPSGDLDAFDPFTDAVPRAFRRAGERVRVRVTDRGAGALPVGGEYTRAEIAAGECEVPVYAAAYLAARGRAEIVPE